MMKPTETLVIKTVNSDMTSHGGFLYPERGMVEAQDWDGGKPVCGGGLHGIPKCIGEEDLLSTDESAKWLVLKVDKEDGYVEFWGKCKFKRGEVVFCGDKAGAVKCISDAFPTERIMFADRTGGDGCRLVGGNFCTLTGGNECSLSADDRSTLKGGDGSVLKAVDYCILTGGNNSVVIARSRGHLTGGDGATLISSVQCFLTGGNGSMLLGGDECVFTGGMWSIFSMNYWDIKLSAWRKALAEVDGKTILPGVSYTYVIDEERWAEATPENVIICQ